KFTEKSDEGFLVGYSLSSKAFRVYNLETKRVEENLHINFLENKPNVARKGHTWLFDLDYLTDSLNYRPITAENKAKKTAGPKETNNSGGTQDGFDVGNSDMKANHAQGYYVLPLWSSYTSTVKSSEAKNGDQKLNGDTGSKTNEEPVDQEDQAFLEELERLKRQEKEANDAAKTLRKTFAQNIMDLLLQTEAARASSTIVKTASTPIETKKPLVKDEEVVDVTSKTSHLQVVKKIFRYLKGQPKLGLWYPKESAFDLEAYSDSDYAGANLDRKSTTGGCQFLGRRLILWQCKKKTIVATSTTKAEDAYEKKLIQVLKIHTDDNVADLLTKAFDVSRFQMSSMDELTFFLGLQVKRKEDGIFISQDIYIAEILKKFDFLSVKTASTPIETKKPLVKDEEVVDVDVHLYRSMIGSLLYMTAYRPDIMYVVCACSRFQVTLKTSHLQVVKRIFRYLKGQLKLGLWYPKESAFDLEAYSDSDYA
nr:hypothetical protein [Tanacetum cinerariifolium]